MHNKDSAKTNCGSSDENELIDEYDLFYGDGAIDQPDEEIQKIPGPLSRRPSLRSTIPFFVISIFFVLFTFASKDNEIYNYLWASRETVYSKHEYWRLFTAIFTHSGGIHLLSNIPLFFFFGLFLYEYFGFMMFPVLSIMIGFTANALTLYFYTDNVRLIGASGMVYGMVSLWLILYIYYDSDHSIPLRIFRSVGFTLIIMFPTAYDPEISYMAHATGFFLGILAALIVLPFIKVKE